MTDKLLRSEAKPKKHQGDTGSPGPPEQATVERLNRAATEKLAEMVRRYGAGERLWQGYDGGEIAAARALLAGSSTAEAR